MASIYTGWPTYGAEGADLVNAQRYNQGVIRHVNSGRGTPRASNERIETFIYEAFDEPNAPTSNGTVDGQPFFGVNYEVGIPKYPLDWRV